MASICSFVKILSIVIGLCVLGHCRVAFSEDVDLKAKAQEHFLRGETLFEAGRYEEAAAAFILAYETLPHVAVLANIGLSYERAGVYPLAVDYLRRYLDALAGAGEENPKIEEVLRESLTKVSEIVVSTKGFGEDCQIFVDNVSRGPSPVHVVVLPGDHDIRVVSGGEPRVTEKLTIDPGETRHFTLSEIDAPKIEEEIETKKSGLGAPFWVAVASSVGTGIASGVLWGATISTKKDFDSTTDTKEQERLQNKGEQLQISASVTAGIAGGAAVTAMILGVVHAVSSKKDAAIAVSPEMVGISVRF